MSLFRNAVENVSYQTKEDWTKSSPECCSISVFKNRLQNSKENTRADNKLNKDDQSYSPFIVCKYSKFTWIILFKEEWDCTNSENIWCCGCDIPHIRQNLIETGCCTTTKGNHCDQQTYKNCLCPHCISWNTMLV